MTIIGYGRVSTLDQNLAIQEAALKAAGCDVIRSREAQRHHHQRPSRTADRVGVPAAR